MVAAASCNNTNPFLTEWDTPYGIPDFGAVKEKHYVPAFEAGIAQQQAEIDAINNEHAWGGDHDPVLTAARIKYLDKIVEKYGEDALTPAEKRYYTPQ